MIYAREADLKVVEAFTSGKYSAKERNISVRDKVFIRLDNSARYMLWNTELVRRLTDGRIWIYITDNSDMDYIYYRNYGRRREMAMTQTTKNRLNAFLSYYGFNGLEVHSSKKLFGVWHNGKELINNSWYELDMESKELIKID
jgi:hypothetical protein